MSTGMIYQITLIGKRAVNAERRFSAARNAMVKNQPVKMTVKRRVPLQSGFKKQPTFVVIFRLKPKPFQPAAGIGVQNERRFEKGIDEDYVRRFFSDTRQRQKLVPQAVLVDCLYRFAGVTVSGVPIGQRADSLCLPSCKAAGTEAGGQFFVRHSRDGLRIAQLAEGFARSAHVGPCSILDQHGLQHHDIRVVRPPLRHSISVEKGGVQFVRRTHRVKKVSKNGSAFLCVNRTSCGMCIPIRE